jgi:hypothetical protein
LNRAFIEPRVQTVAELYVTDRTVVQDDDFKDDLAGEAAPPCFLRVIGFDLANKTRRRDSAASAIWTATHPAARTWPDTSPRAFANADARAGPCAATDPAST